MIKLMFSIFFTLILLPHTTLGCGNYRQVEGCAGKFVTRLWDRKLILEPDLREAVQQLPLRSEIDKNHFSLENFHKLWEEECGKIPDGQFHYFANLCKRMYETCDEMDKVKVFVILSHVSHEYRKLFIRLQRCSSSKDQKTEFDPGLIFSNFMGMFSPLSTDSIAKDTNKEPEIKCDWSYKVDTIDLYASQLHDRVRRESKQIPCDDIRQRLDFMYKPDDDVKNNIERKYYIKLTTFQTYFEGVTANITGERFLAFAVACKHLYEELKEFQDRLALFLLLEKVAEKEKNFFEKEKYKEIVRN